MHCQPVVHSYRYQQPTRFTKLRKHENKTNEKTNTIARQRLRDSKNSYRDTFFNSDTYDRPLPESSRVKKITPSASNDMEILKWIVNILNRYLIDVRALAEFDPGLFDENSLAEYALKSPYKCYDNSDFDCSTLIGIYKKHFKSLIQFEDWVIQIDAEQKKISFILGELQIYNVDVLLFAELDKNLFDSSIFDQESCEEGLMGRFDYSKLPDIYDNYFDESTDGSDFYEWLSENANKKYIEEPICYSDSEHEISSEDYYSDNCSSNGYHSDSDIAEEPL